MNLFPPLSPAIEDVHEMSARLKHRCQLRRLRIVEKELVVVQIQDLRIG
jgi:translation initiation factor IF-1